MPAARICIDENLGVANGDLVMQGWASPRPVVDTIVTSTGDGAVVVATEMPGVLLMDKQVGWLNDTPLEQGLLIRVTRASRSIVVSNPNAIQFRDRWTYDVDRDPEAPVTTGVFNSQFGASVDLGTNTMAEPMPGVMWQWQDADCTDEWVTPLKPGREFRLWYRCYRWTPPPWSDNANLGSPTHSAKANWTRIQLIAFPMQGSVVSG